MSTAALLPVPVRPLPTREVTPHLALVHPRDAASDLAAVEAGLRALLDDLAALRARVELPA